MQHGVPRLATHVRHAHHHHHRRGQTDDRHAVEDDAADAPSETFLVPRAHVHWATLRDQVRRGALRNVPPMPDDDDAAAAGSKKEPSPAKPARRRGQVHWATLRDEVKRGSLKAKVERAEAEGTHTTDEDDSSPASRRRGSAISERSPLLPASVSPTRSPRHHHHHHRHHHDRHRHHPGADGVNDGSFASVPTSHARSRAGSLRSHVESHYATSTIYFDDNTEIIVSDSSSDDDDGRGLSIQGDGPKGTAAPCCAEGRHPRWRLLLFICLLTMGTSFNYDFPGAIGTGPEHTIEDHFEDGGHAYSQRDNLLMYSVYSYPNVVVTVFGGVLIDKVLGLRRSMLLFSVLVFLGTALFYLGLKQTRYSLLLVGRVVLGLGGESLYVAQSAYLARWFKKSTMMALAFALVSSISKTGSSFTFLLSPRIARSYGVEYALLVGCVVALASFVCCVVLLVADVYGESRELVAPPKKKPVPTNATDDDGTPKTFGQKVMAVCRNVGALPGTLWLLYSVSLGRTASTSPFIAIARNMFEVKYQVSADTAAMYVSLYQFTCAGLAPFVGIFIDKFGRFTVFISLAIAGFVGVHSVFCWAHVAPYIMMPLMGVSSSFLTSVMKPCIPFLVDEHLTGVAYGLLKAVQNIGLATFPIITGNILDAYTPDSGPLLPGANGTGTANHSVGSSGNTTNDEFPPAPLPTLEGFTACQYLFIGVSGAALLCALSLLVTDVCRGGLLFASPKQRAEILLDRIDQLSDSGSSYTSDDETDGDDANVVAGDAGEVAKSDAPSDGTASDWPKGNNSVQ